MARLLAGILMLTPAASGFELPRNCSQVVVGITSTWQSSYITVSAYEKGPDGTWRKAAGPWAGRCAKKGLAWGRGLHPLAPDSPRKTEGDWRSPAGVFRIGGAWGYHKAISKHPELTYRRVTSRDLWVEDPSSSYYNRHLILGHEPSKVWEKKAQMRQDDYPHSLKLYIAHNTYPKPLPGAGSAIFFHIWRDKGSRPTSGCTTMPEKHLRALIALIDPGRNPLYVLLPRENYSALKNSWRLP